MANKTDVKAMMARFQANASNSEEPTSTSAGHSKPQHPMPSGPAMHMKRTVSDGLPGSGAAIPPKPSFLKNSPSSNNDPVGQEPNKTKALASRFNTSQEMNKPFLQNKSQSKPSFTQTSDFKAPPLSKPDTKPAFPKPAVTNIKPSWVKENSTTSASPPPPNVPSVQVKPSNNIFKLQQQMETKAEVTTDSVNKPAAPVNTCVKPSNFKAAQNLFNKDPPEQSNGDITPSAVNKPSPNVPSSIPPPKPPPSKKPSLKKPSARTDVDDPSAPKKNPLPNSLALGAAPSKPNRPPNVDLTAFKKESETNEGKGKSIAPPLPSHPINQSNHVTPAPPPVPSLPPGHPGSNFRNQTQEMDDFYDDVDGFTVVPPPLPPVHPSQKSKGKDESGDEDGEMYEDLDDRWEEQSREKKKDDKEEKKRLEAEKKEQKEREKKEQDARKKFKLVGALEVLHKGKACVDCKGNKTDLSLKEGESLDIIRVLGNPEGKWLGRTQDGSIGYVKITSVKIDYDSLKKHAAEQVFDDVYDDVDMTLAEQSQTKAGVVLPPLPVPGEDIYDDVDPNLDVSPSDPGQSHTKPRVFQWMLERSRRAPSIKVLPTPSHFSKDSDHKGGITDEEIYDDVDTNAPATPSMISMSKVDPKKQKKLEKEEKEFRKKFKYDGEIQVLHQVTIIPKLTNKKWSSKELPLKAGEKLDVIVQAVDNKFLCRNDDGKFGYVSTCYVVSDDGDIYDDIGDDCIYDND